MNHFVFKSSATPARASAQRRYCLKNLERGASLLEAVAYLGIAAVVVLGAVSLLNGAFGSAKSNQTTEEVVALRTAVRKLYIGQVYPTGSLADSLVAANAIPATLGRVAAAGGTGGGTLQNSWGGAVAITGTATGFTISYALIPQDVCVNLISGASGWTSIAQGAAAGLTAFPVTAAQATTLCSGATNTVTFSAS